MVDKTTTFQDEYYPFTFCFDYTTSKWERIAEAKICKCFIAFNWICKVRGRQLKTYQALSGSSPVQSGGNPKSFAFASWLQWR